MHVIEMASIGSRVAGRIKKRVALGTTLQQSIKTASVFLLVPFLPTLGYLVESGISVETYLQIVFFAFFLSFLFSILMIIKLNTLQSFFQVVFNKYTLNTIPIAIVKSFIYKGLDQISAKCRVFSFDKIIIKKTLVSLLAYLFLITGFFIAFFLAIIFPENRLTMSQFTATFHGFGAVIFAFYLDPMLSRSIDALENDEAWLKNVYSILLGRALSYFCVTLLLMLYFLYKFLS